MDVYNLEFPDNHFDGVFSIAFEFITQPGKAYSEMFRVLKPGADFIGTINRDSKWGNSI